MTETLSIQISGSLDPSANSYGNIINKNKCVGHIEKRMDTRQKNVKQKQLRH